MFGRKVYEKSDRGACASRSDYYCLFVLPNPTQRCDVAHKYPLLLGEDQNAPLSQFNDRQPVESWPAVFSACLIVGHEPFITSSRLLV